MENENIESKEQMQSDQVETTEAEPEPNEFQKMLDELTDETEAEPGEPEQKEEEEESLDDIPEASDQHKQPEQEEEELLSEVKSERGRKRVSELIETHKKIKTERDELHGFVESITTTGMSPDELAQTLEYCRLASSSDKENLRIAAGILEQQRKALYLRMGETAPGIDPLEDFPDLQDMADIEVPQSIALELAQLRRMKADQQQQLQRQNETAKTEQHIRETVNHIRQHFDRFKGQPGHEEKERKMTAYFQDKEKAERLLRLPPEQWLSALQMVYDNIPVPTPKPQPLRSRPTTLSSGQIDPALKGADRISAIVDELGL